MRYVALILGLLSAAYAINYHGCTLAPDGLHGWVVCIDTALIMYTTDGGITWTPQSVPPDTFGRELFDVTCTDGSNAWTTGKHNLQAAEILHTSDGGNYWYRQIAGFSKYGTRIEFIDQDHGWALGGNGALARTTDGGNFWDQVFTDWYEAEYYGVSFLNTMDGWICAGWPDSLLTGQGYIGKSTDGGLTWDTLIGYHAPGYEDFFDLHFFDLNQGIVVGGYEDSYVPIILKTTNGGLNYSQVSAPTNTSYLRALDFVDQEGWAVGKSGTIIHTTDSGNSWSTQNSSADTTLFDVDFSDHQNGLACGYGYILRTTDGGQNWQSVGIEELSTNIPVSISLSINPNPSTKATNVRFRIQDTGYTEHKIRNSNFEMRKHGMKIYDSSGRLIKSFDLESSIQNQESEVLWDGTDERGERLPSGIYFVELRTPEYSLTEKIVLLE